MREIRRRTRRRFSAEEKVRVVLEGLRGEESIAELCRREGIASNLYYRWSKDFLEAGKKRLNGDTVREATSGEVKFLRSENRELACRFTDERRYFLSESSVYRILKAYDLITSPAYVLLSASDRFSQPSRRVHELWQTDFTYLRVIGWGWYYLSTVMDDFSRYLIAWRLSPTMGADDVMETLNEALERTGVETVNVRHRPRLLSDNGPAYVSKELREYLAERGMTHTRGRPYHPQTQGKIERYHRSMKNVVKLEHYYFPWQLEQAIGDFVAYYNHERYHESLENVTPLDVYSGRYREVLSERKKIKRLTMQRRKREYRAAKAA